MPDKELAQANRDEIVNLQRTYSVEKALAVCTAIAEGRTMKDIAKMDGMPSRPTLYRWIAAFPEFAAAYDRARSISAQSFEEEALELARILIAPNDFTSVKVRAHEVAMAQLRWSAARRDPKRYGVAQNTGQPMAIQINTSLNLGQEGPVDLSKATTSSSVYSFSAQPIPADADELPLDENTIDLQPVQDDSGALVFGDLDVKAKGRPGIAPSWSTRTPKRHPKHKSAIGTAKTIEIHKRTKNGR